MSAGRGAGQSLEALDLLKAILLGPNSQLGTDIRSANERQKEPISITPVARAQVDLSDIDFAIRVLYDLDFDVLINCSSYHKTDEVERNAGLAFTINAHLVHRLAELCQERKARLVHFSTDYVFGGQTEREPLAENAAKAPLNVYGASKGMGEDLALLTGADILILRVASLFGVAGASGKGGNFVETMIRVGRERGALRVVSDQIMSPTGTADVANALLTLLLEQAPSGVWHVVNSGAASWYDFACRIVERAGVKATVISVSSGAYPTFARRPSYSVLSTAKLASAIGHMRLWQDALDAYLEVKGYLSA